MNGASSPPFLGVLFLVLVVLVLLAVLAFVLAVLVLVFVVLVLVFVVLVLVFVVLVLVLAVLAFVLAVLVLILVLRLVRLGRRLRGWGSGAWLAFMLRGFPFPILIAFRGLLVFRRVARGTAAIPSMPIMRIFRAPCTVGRRRRVRRTAVLQATTFRFPPRR